MSDTGKSKLSVRGAHKTHGSVVALESASFELYEGEFLTLLGPSGSGKTTLLLIVAGLSDPTGGEVWIDGRLATYAPPHQRDIGMVFQSYALFPHLTVRENIAFPLRMRGVPEQELARRVTEALETVQLAHTAERYPRNLSGGQQQRIALARCFVYRPSIILMDEPLGALDRKLRDQMQLEIKELHRNLGITVLYVTHDQDEAMTMSDRICLMNEGKIEQIGTPEDLYFRPSSVFAADFIGDSNLIEVTVDGRDASIHRLRGPGNAPLSAEGHAPLDAGDKACLVVRPENLHLLDDGQTMSNMLRGVVTESVFVGAVYKYCVELPDGARIWGKHLGRDPSKNLQPGAHASVGWAFADGVLLPAAGKK